MKLNADIVEITHKDIDLLYCDLISGNSVALFGAPGIGKSWILLNDVAEMLSKYTKRKLVAWETLTHEERLEVLQNLDKYFITFDIRLTQYTFDEVKGVLDIRSSWIEDLERITSVPVVTWRLPMWLAPVLKKDFAGLIVFDDAPNAHPSTMISAYRYVLKKEHELGKFSVETFVALTGNEMHHKTFANALPTAMVSRLAIYRLQPPSAEFWIENFALKHKIHPYVIGYFSNPENADKFYRFEPQKLAPNQPYPCPRSWHLVSNALYKAEEVLKPRYDEETYLLKLETLVASKVGIGIAREFVAWLKLHKHIPRIQDIFRNPSILKLSDRADINYLIVSGITNYWRQLSEEKKNNLFINLLEIFGRFADAPEFLTLLVVLIKSVDPYFIQRYVNARASGKVPKKIRDLLRRYTREYIDWELTPDSSS